MLSKYFSLEEMIFSQTAVRNGIDNTPGVNEIENLKRLCSELLDPLCDVLGLNIRVSSGYRSATLNKKIGGAANSQHVKGQAADINAEGLTANELYEKIKIGSALNFDQLIQEFDSWVHISWAVNPRCECLIAKKIGGKTAYFKDE